MVQDNFDSTNQLYLSRKSFYKKYGNSFFSAHGYGNSELAFLQWLIRRGVLGNCDADLENKWQGSYWWYRVHKDYTKISETAAMVFENNIPEELENYQENLIKFWIEYFRVPNSQNWYQAHNASIVYAYIKNKEHAKRENKFEQFLINVVLYRMLIAQYIVTNGEGSNSWLIRWCAHPTFPMIKNLLKIQAAYPLTYPLDEKFGENFIEREKKYLVFNRKIRNSQKLSAKIRRITSAMHYFCPATLIRFLGPEIDTLYKIMSDKLEIEDLQKFQSNGKAIYPYISQ